MSEAEQTLAGEIADTLRSIIYVPRTHEGSFVARPDFWRRCRLVNPDWRKYRPQRTFVDGYESACRWNSWRVYSDSLENGLSLWMGFAFGWGYWCEHAWCMLGDRIIETTYPFYIYFGAALTPEECAAFGRRYGEHDMTGRDNLRVWTFVDGYREVVAYNRDAHGASIGRERDPQTGKIREGLGRA